MSQMNMNISLMILLKKLGEKMDFKEVLINAKNNIGPYCKACNVCNGYGCKGQIPGPGAKGRGDGAIKNYEAWSEYRINMDTISDIQVASTDVIFFGHHFKAPIFAGPVGAVKSHYGDKYSDMEYNKIMLEQMVDDGLLAFTGDGKNESVVIEACMALDKLGGKGIPTIKPWDIPTMKRKIDLANKANCLAIACDIDASGLPFLKNNNPPAGAKTTSELKEIIEYAKKPFIIKGIMTVKGALKAIEAGASAIVVSNHGGRVLDDAMPTALVLPQIVKVVAKKCLVFVDGGIRSGADIFKALALGADGVLIARPYAVALYGNEKEGIHCYSQKLISELEDVMLMAGAKSIEDIKPEMITKI